MMKRALLIAACLTLAVPTVLWAGLPINERDRPRPLSSAVPCLDGDRCEAGFGSRGCSASITGCGSHGRCAYCSCSDGEIITCTCDCRGSASDSVTVYGDVPAYRSLKDPATVNFGLVTFKGLREYIRRSFPKEWVAVSTVEPGETITYQGEFPFEQGFTIEEVLRVLASWFGVCVDGSDRTKTISFHPCR